VLEAIKFWSERRRIQSSIDRISQAHKEQVKKARESGASEDKIHEISELSYIEHEEAEDEMRRLHSAYYIRAANKLMIPVTSRSEDDAWVESPFDGSSYLSPEALHKLRAEVRAERRARQEWLTVWLSLVVAAIGSCAALVAVWKA
jgi:hypothetical protein